MSNPEKTGRTQNENWSLAWQFARCELRHSVMRFRIFLAALMLGVAAIGAVGSVAESMRSGITDNGRMLLGGDFELSSLHVAPDKDLLDKVRQTASLSEIIQMRAMLGKETGTEHAAIRKLVELKAVDEAYPLVGIVELSPPQTLKQALADRGAVVAPALLRATGLSVGDKAQLGEITITVRGVLDSEPDQTISFVSFGPRLMVSTATLNESGLRQEGAFITYRNRAVVRQASQLEDIITELDKAVENTHIRLRTTDSAAGAFDRFIERAERFLMLVSLTALLIGGLGVSGAVRAWLQSRMTVIATLKCVGATSNLIFRVYMLQVLAMAGLGIAGGLVLAGLTPFATTRLFADYVNVPLDPTFYPRPLAIAAAFGFLTTLVFALWPLSRTQFIRASHLFRTLSEPLLAGREYCVGAIIICCAGLLSLALLATGNIVLSFSFLVGTGIALLFLSGLGEAVLRGLRLVRSPRYIPARLALSAITRQGSPLRSIILAFGLGLSVLVAVTSSQHNLASQLNGRAENDAPDWFFIDIQPEQITPFITLVQQQAPNTVIEQTPMLRGRVTALDGVPASQFSPDNESSWILRGDRALTWQALPPGETKIMTGSWWSSDYSGPPLLSITHEMAEDFGLAVGDSVSLNILGREITGEIANTREVAWESFRINFVFIMSPGLLEGAPHSWIATTKSDTDDTASKIEQAVTSSFKNISALSVRQAVSTVEKVLDLLGNAIQLTAAVTLLSGLAVLAGSVATSEAQRISDSIILKVLGARRTDIILSWLFEYALLGF
ncbi:MAG: glycosyl transferase family 1 [Alphaproteobacteria bacterium]|nr:MAG: glycosyl transferase family 1 [Alphaproteobacteria bacterium]